MAPELTGTRSEARLPATSEGRDRAGEGLGRVRLNHCARSSAMHHGRTGVRLRCRVVNQPEQNTRWAVAVEGQDADIRTVASALNDGGILLELHEQDGWLLTAGSFGELGEADAVRRSSEEIMAVVNGVGTLLDPGFRPLKAGHVYRLHADGRKDAFVLLQSAIEVRARVNAVLVSATSDGSPPSPPTSQLENALAAAAFDSDLNLALRLNGKHPRTLATLYKIFELSQQHPQHKAWSSTTQRRRFTHSVNSPDAHGEDARHAVQKTQPPANPMSLKEAEALISVILARWVETVWMSLDES